MAQTRIHQEIMGALFDVEKLCVTSECVRELRRYRAMFPNREMRQKSKSSLFFQKFFCDLHQDAVICYLEKAKGWPLNGMQKQFARMDIDTQISLAIAADWGHVIGFYSQWFDRLEAEFDKQYFDDSAPQAHQHSSSGMPPG